MDGVIGTLTDDERAKAKSALGRKWLRWAIVASVVWMVGCFLFVVGARARQWVWVTTEEIRFNPNIDNAYAWGVRVNHDAQEAKDAFVLKPSTWREFLLGYRRIYDREWDAPSLRAMMVLDYPPMRLLTVALWARWVPGPPDGREIGAWMRAYFFGGAPTGVWTWEDASGILAFNTFCGAMGAIGVFFLVRGWVRRENLKRWKATDRGDRELRIVDCGLRIEEEPRSLHSAGLPEEGEDARARGKMRGWVYGSIAAILVWMNLAVLVDGYGWPQWDIWAVPFYVWACVAASGGWWMAAGMLIGVGVMFKAQLVMVGPVILIWALGMGVRPFLRFVLGFAFAGAVITSIWLLPSIGGWVWFGGIVGAAAISAVGWRIWRGRWTRNLGYWAALVAVIGIGSGCYLYDGSFAWLKVGFLNPTEGHPALSMGAINLPAILEKRFGWGLWDSVGWEWLIMRDLLRGVYLLGLLLCGVVAAIQARRGSARVLLALVAPWVILYAVMPQLHERHVLWAAAISAIAIGVSADYVWLHLVLTFVGVMGILAHMLPRSASLAPRLLKFVNGVSPDLGWVVLLLAGIYLWGAWKRDRWRTQG